MVGSWGRGLCSREEPEMVVMDEREGPNKGADSPASPVRRGPFHLRHAGMVVSTNTRWLTLLPVPSRPVPQIPRRPHKPFRRRAVGRERL